MAENDLRGTCMYAREYLPTGPGLVEVPNATSRNECSSDRAVPFFVSGSGGKGGGGGKRVAHGREEEAIRTGAFFLLLFPQRF